MSLKGKPSWNKNLQKELNPNFGRKYSKERCQKISQSNKGKIVSNETKLRLSESHKGQKSWNKGQKGLQKHSEEVRKKMSISGKGKKVKPVLQFDMNNNFIKEWIGVNYVSPEFSPSKVSLCCNNKRNKHKNFIWIFKTN